MKDMLKTGDKNMDFGMYILSLAGCCSVPTKSGIEAEIPRFLP